ncbi:glycoside hydrolase family 3 [Fusarium denticulatum]|uniref:beta-glucosidase n=1 Tax=Fusarium denticulatum TaxID=48507 RepID=A0A8H5U583_9HYPO|nr:glycoside hydrolase family 3 [Fusarium denticulatum]
MLILSTSRLLVSVVSLGTIVTAQSPQDLPLDDATKRLSPRIARFYRSPRAHLELREEASGLPNSSPMSWVPVYMRRRRPERPHGVEAVNGYAAGVTVAAAWNREFAHARGRHMGLEAKRRGVNNLLGQTIGPLGRTVFGGRNWEYLSVDPYLCGVMGAQTVEGMQQHVIVTAKDFIANEQETNRNPSTFSMGNGSVTANLDDRTMHELYLWPFQDLVKAGNSYRQNGLLKTELGFQGFVITDAGALHSGVSSANACAHVTTPFNELWRSNLTEAIANGTMAESRVNDMVTRVYVYVQWGRHLLAEQKA